MDYGSGVWGDAGCVAGFVVDAEGAVDFVEGLDAGGELADVEAVGVHRGRLLCSGWVVFNEEFWSELDIW